MNVVLIWCNVFALMFWLKQCTYFEHDRSSSFYQWWLNYLLTLLLPDRKDMSLLLAMTSVLAIVSLSSSPAHHFWRHFFSSLCFFSSFLSHGLTHMFRLTSLDSWMWVSLGHDDRTCGEGTIYVVLFLAYECAVFFIFLFFFFFVVQRRHSFPSKIESTIHSPSLSLSLLALQTG